MSRSYSHNICAELRFHNVSGCHLTGQCGKCRAAETDHGLDPTPPGPTAAAAVDVPVALPAI